MNTTIIIGLSIAFFLIAVAVAAVVVVVRLLGRPRRRTPSPGQASAAADTSALMPAVAPDLAPSPAAPARLLYARIPHLLTPAEGDFFAVLQAAVPAGMLLFAQVRLANLVEVQPWARRDKTHWYKIQAKCVDFVICEPRTFVPRLVIELDDSSHKRADRRARDAFVDDVLAAVSLPILHVRWRPRYDPRDLTQQIAFKLPGAQPIIASGAPHPVPIIPPPQPAEVFLTLIAPSNPPMHHACDHCKGDIRAGAKFCPSCGAVFASH